MSNAYVPSTVRRLVAWGIDQVVRLPFYLPFAKSFFLLAFTEEDVHISLVHLFLIFMVPAIYEFVFLVIMQATPGKWVMGLKVVPFSNPDEKLEWQQCVLRPLTERLSFFLSWAVYALAFFRYDRTHLADWVAETRVVQGTPRMTRARVRWFLGTLLVLGHVYEGLVSSSSILQSIDWSHGQVELRSLIEIDSLEDVMDDYDV